MWQLAAADLGMELLQESAADAESTNTKMKLVLLKPEKGQNMKALLESLQKKAAKGLGSGADSDATG